MTELATTKLTPDSCRRAWRDEIVYFGRRRTRRVCPQCGKNYPSWFFRCGWRGQPFGYCGPCIERIAEDAAKAECRKALTVRMQHIGRELRGEGKQR